MVKIEYRKLYEDDGQSVHDHPTHVYLHRIFVRPESDRELWFDNTHLHKASWVLDEDDMFAFAITNTKTSRGGHSGQGKLYSI